MTSRIHNGFEQLFNSIDGRVMVLQNSEKMWQTRGLKGVIWWTIIFVVRSYETQNARSTRKKSFVLIAYSIVYQQALGSHKSTFVDVHQ